MNTSIQPPQQRNLEPLMREYVAICNHAMAKSKDQFWYQQAHKISKAVDGKNFRTLVYEDNPTNTQAAFTLHFDAEKPELRLDDSASEEDAIFTWKTPVSYLKDVVEERPTWYLEQPTRLDWQWLKARANDTLEHRPPASTLTTGILIGAATFALGYFVASSARRR